MSALFYSWMPLEAFSTLSLFLVFIWLFVWKLLGNGAGKSLGKRIMKIKTVNAETMGPIDIKQSALNALGKVFTLLDLIIGMATKDKTAQPDIQDIRIMQRIAKTSVIKLQ